MSEALALRPKTLDEAMKLAESMAKSDIIPNEYRGKPGNIVIAAMLGSELGLGVVQAMQSIFVINGKPTLYGDGALAVVQGHPDYKSHTETSTATSASCTIVRRDHDPYTVTFTVEQAQKAGLWGKQGPWTQYPQRMLQMRARSWALRDKFADALKGIAIREEVEDYETVTTTAEGAEIQMPKRLSAPVPDAPRQNGAAEKPASPVPAPPVAQAAPTAEPVSEAITYASPKEVGRLRATMKGTGKTETDLIDFLGKSGVVSPDEIPSGVFAEAVKWAKSL